MQYNKLKEYLAIGSIKNKLESDIHEAHKQFFNSYEDPSTDGHAANQEKFKSAYKDFMKHIADEMKMQIKKIRTNINAINHNSEIKQNIKDILNRYINIREETIDNILYNINLNNIYQDYVKYYDVLQDEKDNNINRENDKQNIIRRNMPVLP